MSEQTDLESLSVEELDAILRKTPPIPPPEPGEPLSLVPEVEAEQPPAEAPPEPAEEAKPEPEAEPEAPKEDLSDQAILKAQIEHLEAQAKHWEQVAGRNGGELGYLRSQMQKLQTALEARQGQDFPVEEAAEPRPASKSAPEQKDGLLAWAISKAVTEASQQFVAEHPDFPELQETIKSYAASSGYDPSRIIQAEDPLSASRETTRFLAEAYYHAQAQRKAQIVAELMTKKADQMRGLEKAKAKAAVSASGSAPPPKPQPKAYEDMTVEELDQVLKRMTSR